MIDASKVIIALDTQDSQKVNHILDSISGYKVWVKIGMEIFYSHGQKIIDEVKKKDFKVFLDLKLHDIPNTVAQALRALRTLPIDMVNVHASGGLEMMKRANEAIKTGDHHPLLIAVTQLTSTTQKQLNDEQKIPGFIQDSVVHYSKLALEAGLDGVVSSPLEVVAIKQACGRNFLTVTPGVRPKGSDKQDQNRITTPIEAMGLGTDFIVIGRPITQSPCPREALENILKGIDS